MNCPICGRASQDWRNRSTRITQDGAKIRLREGEDRLEAYRRWHATLGAHLVATDVDSVEWRNGQPIAILEMTMIEGAPAPPPGYFEAIIARKERDREMQRTLLIAERLDVRAYLVCYTADLSEFHAMRVRPWLDGWRKMDADQYAKWIREMGN